MQIWGVNLIPESFIFYHSKLHRSYCTEPLCETYYQQSIGRFQTKAFFLKSGKGSLRGQIRKTFSFLIVKSSYLTNYNIFHMIGYVSLVSIVPDESDDCLIKSIRWITINSFDKYAQIISKANIFYLKQQLWQYTCPHLRHT